MSISATTRRPPTMQGRLTAPWSAVLPLAVLMAYADGFWMVSLRGAVGAIERTQGPFATWLRESTQVLPVFVLAVLGALTLAAHRFGLVLRRPKPVLATGLLIAAACTLVGTVQMAVSSAYDYHLQTRQLLLLNSIHDHAGGGLLTQQQDLLAQQQQASLGLQVHAVGYGAGILLVTNLVLVGWVLAIHGGRLNLSISAARRGGADPALESAPGSQVGGLRLLIAVGFFAAGAVHAAAVPDHLSQWTAAGLFYIVLATTELVVAGRLLIRG